MTAREFIACARPRFWAWLVVAVALGAYACDGRAVAQPPSSARVVPVLRIGYLSPEAKAWLAARWDTTPGQAERAYCVTRWSVDTAYVAEQDVIEVEVNAHEVVQARVYSADPYNVSYDCPEGTLPVHTHPPHTRSPDGRFVAGGWEADQCQPSATDYRSLRRGGEMAGVILCGPTQARWYFPQEFGGN